MMYEMMKTQRSNARDNKELEDVVIYNDNEEIISGWQYKQSFGLNIASIVDNSPL